MLPSWVDFLAKQTNQRPQFAIRKVVAGMRQRQWPAVK